jgi:hypothetical protein
MKAESLLGLSGSFLALASLVLPWWSVSIVAGNYSYMLSCYAWGLKETGYIPGVPSVVAFFAYPINTVIMFIAVFALISALLGIIGSFWKPGFMGEAWPIAFIVPIVYLGIFYMLYDIVVKQFAPELQVTTTWTLQAGWFVIIIAGILFLVAQHMMRKNRASIKVKRWVIPWN